MAYIECLDLTSFLTQAFKDEAVCTELRELRRNHAAPAALLEAISRHASPEVAANARMEMGELPAYTIEMIVSAWEVADAARKPVTVFSEKPASPLKFARDRRVGINVEADNEEIRIGVQHVASRHADWYKVAAHAS